MRSRVPIYGRLFFVRERASDHLLTRDEGVDVGKEHSYRKYIAGGAGTPHRAIWSFLDERASERDCAS